MNGSWLVLANPHAGRGRSIEDRTGAAVRATGVSADVVAPPSGASMRAAVRQGVEDGRRLFAVVGGDGTLNLVVDELMRCSLSEPPTVALLPAGSGSDFARTFALPQSIEESAHHLQGTTDYALDVGFVEGAWGRRAFVNVAEAGLTASCLDLANRLPRRLGGAKYQMAFWATLPRFPPTHIEVVTERRSFEGEALVAVFANAQFFGGGFNIAPKAAAMDGLLDIQVFSATRRQVVTLFPAIKRGLHLRHPAVRRMSAQRFRLTTSEPWTFEVDGEVLGDTPVEGWVEQGRMLLRL